MSEPATPTPTPTEAAQQRHARRARWRDRAWATTPLPPTWVKGKQAALNIHRLDYGTSPET